jgi:hypothetical protein
VNLRSSHAGRFGSTGAQGRAMVVFRGNWAQATDVARTNARERELVEVS